MENNNLKKLYDERYLGNYMDEWKGGEKKLIIDLIHSFNLPEKGFALDYGCGNGVFVEVLQAALPYWTVYGCDISQNAISNAQQRYPNHTFFVSESGKFDPALKNKFNLVFSHHVLEHVINLKDTNAEILYYLQQRSDIFHVLPCGNKGSLEYNICKLHVNGIDASNENRFITEAVGHGHLRRLRTDDLIKLMEPSGFIIKNEYYTNQFWGGIYYLTNNNIELINDLIKLSSAINVVASLKLFCLKITLLSLFYLQKPYKLWGGVKSKKNKRFIHYLFLICDFVPSLITGWINIFLNYKTRKEQKNNNQSRNGSGMYVHFNRQD